MKKLEGNLHGEGLKIGIVLSRFNNLVTERLLTGAEDKLTRLGVDEENITVAYVPGSFELPRAVRSMGERGEVDGIIALGAVIRGETPHFEYVANESAKGLANLNLKMEVPVAFGVITADTLDQAIDRAGAKQGNKGSDSAEALIEMINLEGSMIGNNK